MGRVISFSSLLNCCTLMRATVVSHVRDILYRFKQKPVLLAAFLWTRTPSDKLLHTSLGFCMKGSDCGQFHQHFMSVFAPIF